MIPVNQAGLGFASKTACARNQVASETEEKDKAAFYPFRRLLNIRRIQANTNPSSNWIKILAKSDLFLSLGCVIQIPVSGL